LSFYNVIEKICDWGRTWEWSLYLLKIACECVHPFPEQRPTMLEVYNNMSNVRKDRYDYGEESDTLRVF
jgi:hypothetical protein